MGLVEKIGQKTVLKQVKEAIKKAYKQGRLKFCFGDSQIEYVDKNGETQILTINECASLLWVKMNNEMMGVTGVGSLGIFDISVEDIKKIILKLR